MQRAWCLWPRSGEPGRPPEKGPGRARCALPWRVSRCRGRGWRSPGRRGRSGGPGKGPAAWRSEGPPWTCCEALERGLQQGRPGGRWRLCCGGLFFHIAGGELAGLGGGYRWGRFIQFIGEAVNPRRVLYFCEGRGRVVGVVFFPVHAVDKVFFTGAA